MRWSYGGGRAGSRHWAAPPDIGPPTDQSPVGRGRDIALAVTLAITVTLWRHAAELAAGLGGGLAGHLPVILLDAMVTIPVVAIAV